MEWVHPSHTATTITKKKLKDIAFPTIIKLCPDPGFNITAMREEGYRNIWGYFVGQSIYNSSLYGWAGHTETMEQRGTVRDVYKKLQYFPAAENFLEM